MNDEFDAPVDWNQFTFVRYPRNHSLSLWQPFRQAICTKRTYLSVRDDLKVPNTARVHH